MVKEEAGKEEGSGQPWAHREEGCEGCIQKEERDFTRAPKGQLRHGPKAVLTCRFGKRRDKQ